MRNAGFVAAVVIAMCGSMPAAAQVTLFEFGGRTGTPGEGEFSNYTSRVGHETFTNDIANPAQPCLYSLLRANYQEEFASSVDPTLAEGQADFNRGSEIARRLALTGTDANNCYATVNAPSINDGAGGPVDGAAGTTVPEGNNYLGFYWGSVDTYNYLRFYDGDANPVAFFGPRGEDWGTEISGDEITAASGFAAPDSVYVNFFWDPAIDDVAFVFFGANRWAFEYDNYTISNSFDGDVVPFNALVDPGVSFAQAAAVPAPAMAGLLGLGMLALPFVRRRVRQSS